MRSILLVSSLAFPASLLAIAPEQAEFFENRIRPVLAQECYECHSMAGKKKGGLLLVSRPGWQAGGESGAVIVPGDAGRSLLIETIRHEHEDLKMPKAGAKLEDRVIADFEKWINSGAPDPRDTPPSKEQVAKETEWKVILDRRKDWWAMNPLPPEVKPPGLGHPVDAFIGAALAKAQIPPAAQAAPAVILRRLHFILTGLPPAVGEIEAFVREWGSSSAAPSRERLLSSTIDSLLKSPRFGERWARHWMDWVRYAETYGSEGDPAIPYAWRYRDYLVRAFNDGVPYPQMVREAVAGDLLPSPRINQKLRINESALGIAQLRMVLHGFSPVDSLDEMATFTDNQIDTVTKAFMALTVTCARCHNHKFDAISQTDFYSLYGIFTSTHPGIIDVSVADDRALREGMRALKKQIRDIVGRAWLEAAPPQESPEPKTPPSVFAGKWFAHGRGASAEASPAGEFAIATEGSAIIARVYPRGWFSDAISAKDRAVLASPRFRCEGGTLWVRAAGDGSSRIRYVVQNYPRTGTIHKAIDLKGSGGDALGWRKLDLEYWAGDEIFIECATAADLPAEAKDERSWFGITEWRITGKDDPPPAALAIGGDPRAAIRAWIQGAMTDAQAELLDSLLRAGKLPNDRRKITAAEPLLARYRMLENALPAPVRAPGVLEADATDRPLFERGDHKMPREIVQRRFLEALDPEPYRPKDSGRLQLAEDLADLERNPLAARVIVNRLWHHVFGRGIVRTTDNFGRLGELPSHPELLDFLARRFASEGGSIKAMLKLLVSSEAFLREDRASEAATQRDPDNKLLSHWTVRRLEAEAIRDSILSLSGALDLAEGGESVPGRTPRRSVYVQVLRNNLDDFLSVFDAPMPGSTRGSRDVTNVPAQSLTLLNDPNVQSRAAQWAEIWADKPGLSDEARVSGMFEQAFGRRAREGEIKASLDFMREAGGALKQQLATLSFVEEKSSRLLSEIEGILRPVREKLVAQRGSHAAATARDAPEAFADWDFEKGSDDIKGRLPLKLEGSARIEQGALVLDGNGSMARSSPLASTLREKTLEAWVQLENLDQRGGGVITVQDLRGDAFDSIVFAEKEARCWVPGSDFFRRSELLGGPAESEAASRAVHMAITYAADGTVTAYRDGVPYGKSYKSKGPQTFKAGDAEMVLGCRHGKPSGNRVLTGRILRARLHNRALSAKEVAASSGLEEGVVRQGDILARLSASDRDRIAVMQRESEALASQAKEIRAQIEALGGRHHGWSSLALSLINAKEFVYLR